ncbi:unnamed protein product, partial [Discosporangium mesarthrocarpum]
RGEGDRGWSPSLLSMAAAVVSAGGSLGGAFSGAGGSYEAAGVPEKIVQVVRDRGRKLAEAMTDARTMKPLSGQLLHVAVGKEVPLAVVFTLASKGGAEELQREWSVEKKLQLHLLNVPLGSIPA